MSNGKKFYKVLTETHTHEGEPVPKGTVIELEPRVAESMKDVFAETSPPAKTVERDTVK